MKETLTLIIIGTLIFLNLLTLIWVIFIHKRIKKLTLGKNAKSLEHIISENNKGIHTIKRELEGNKQKITLLHQKIQKSIQYIKVLRFDALHEKNGKQSFAIGLIDENKNGVVLSSMYTRDRMNMFAKKITNGTSEHTLTKEEKEVIN